MQTSGEPQGTFEHFHPDQFVVLNSHGLNVVVSRLVNWSIMGKSQNGRADVINVHGGGVYGDKELALDRLASGINRLSKSRQRSIDSKRTMISPTPR